MPSRRSPARVSSSRSSTSRRSLGPVTNGNMMRSGPCSAARSSARSWARKGSGSRRMRRSARSPSAGFALVGPPGSEVLGADVPGPHRHRVRPDLLEHPPVDLVLPLLVRPPARAAEQVLGAEEPDALRAVLQRVRRLLGELRVCRGERRARRPGSRRAARGTPRAVRPGARSWPARSAASAGSTGSMTTPRACRPPPPWPRPGCAWWRSCRPTTAGIPNERARIDV